MYCFAGVISQKVAGRILVRSFKFVSWYLIIKYYVACNLFCFDDNLVVVLVGWFGVVM